ncbi:hypothetical protein [Burkholderia sp. 3C]
MKALTAAAVATATVASNISYAQPAPVFHMPTALPGSLRYLQPEDAPQTAPALTSHLNSARQVVSPTNQSVSPQGGKEVTQMIPRPKTPVEFAKNLKVIFDSDLLLQDKFYTETNLKNIFNLEEVSISDDVDGGVRHILIMGSVPDSIISRRKVSEDFGGTVPGAQFVGGRKVHSSGFFSAALNFNLDKDGPNFDDAINIFAKKFIRLPPQLFSHGGPAKATEPHGNENWRYQQVDDKGCKIITISFDPTGNLSNIVIELNNN